MTAKQHSAYIININDNEEKDGNVEKVNKTATSSTRSIQQQYHECGSTAFTINDNRCNDITINTHNIQNTYLTNGDEEHNQ